MDDHGIFTRLRGEGSSPMLSAYLVLACGGCGIQSGCRFGVSNQSREQFAAKVTESR